MTNSFLSLIFSEIYVTSKEDLPGTFCCFKEKEGFQQRCFCNEIYCANTVSPPEFFLKLMSAKV